MNKNIEVEGGEIAIRNSHGDLAIIPKDKRDWVKQKLSEGCHGCIDSLVETLPVASQYAQDGTVYPNGTKVKVNQDNQIKEYDISSPEYKDLYNSGKLMSYDKTSDTYTATPSKEVTITAEAPKWLKYKKEYEKTNPKSNYINQYLTPFAKSLGNTETNYPKRLDDEYEQKSLDYASEQLVKNKPQGKLTRAEWLNQMSDKEEELIKRNPKYQSSLWADTKRGLTSLVEQHPLQTFQNILTSSDYSDREKREMLKDYAQHPMMSKLGDAAKILNPLTVPSKMVQSAYKDDYSFTDALKGKKNNAGIVEDIVTDPLNLIGLGIWGKLSKANNFAKLEDAYQAIKTLDKTTLEKQIGTTLSNDDWQYLYRVQEKGFDIEKPTLKAIEERVASGKGKWYDNNILNNPELRANMESRDRYYGQWFEQDPKRLDYYLADKENIEILRAKVPKEILEQYRIDNFDPEIAKKWSLSHETEYIIPKDLIQKAEKFKRNDWQKLIDEHEAIKSKVLNKTDDIIKPAISIADDVSKQASKPAWQMEELPGLHLKSTMDKGAVSKIVEPKTGLVNVEQALGIIGKESGGADKVALIKQGLGENIPKKMDYNEFRKVVQDQLIPLEKQFSKQSSNYGISSLGYPSPKFSSFQSAIKNGEEHILKLETQIDSIKNLKSPVNDGNKLLENLTQELKQAKINLDYNKSMLSKLPLENQTLILGNKSKFGRGSSAHGNPDETLGHIHFLRDAETPDVLTVTQIQSDAFQGTHKIDMTQNSQYLSNLKELESYSKLEYNRFLDYNEELFKNAELLVRSDGSKHYRLMDNNSGEMVDFLSEVEFLKGPKTYSSKNFNTKNYSDEISNISQKQLLSKNHPERYLQELVDYAGKRGDINKIRMPTPETAAKIQGYTPTIHGKYSSKHETILKRYSDYGLSVGKDGKKKRGVIEDLFGVEPKIVTDSKGNTWYEFDIPDKAKKGKMEIKAFTTTGATIGTGAALSNQSKNKIEQ